MFSCQRLDFYFFMKSPVGIHCSGENGHLTDVPSPDAGRARGVCVCAAAGTCARQTSCGFCRLAVTRRSPGRLFLLSEIDFFLIYFAIVCHCFPHTQGASHIDPIACSSVFSRYLRIFCLGNHVIWKQSHFSSQCRARTLPSRGRGHSPLVADLRRGHSMSQQ